MITQLQENEVPAFWQATPQQRYVGIRQLHPVGGPIHDNRVAKQDSRYIGWAS
jgi:hypothetical protein